MTTPASMLQPNRRRILSLLAGLGAGQLAACGGGGSATADDSSSTSSTGDTGGTVGTGSTGSTASIVADPWVWAGLGTSTTATVPTLSDFVSVIADGSVTYSFHASTTSSTTDPVTGVTTDTGTSATLAAYLMGQYLVTNANWKAFCNATGSTNYPSTANTVGQYWNGGAYPAGKERHPVFFVSYTKALAYCAWLETQIPGYHFYVPTEGEWEYAALGSNSGYSYPWGAAAGLSYNAATGALTTPFNCNALCTQWVLNSSGLATLSYYNDSVVTTLSDGSTALSDDTAALSRVLSMGSSGSVSGWQYDSDTNKTWADFANSDQFRNLVNLYGGYSTAVDAFPAGRSWCGCWDMAGNAYEWTSTLNLAANGLEAGSLVNCVKGGSWYATGGSGKSSGRSEGRSSAGAFHSVGFRVAARPR